MTCREIRHWNLSLARTNGINFIARSALMGLLFNENDGLEVIPDINGHRDDYEILGWAVRPGDAIAFDYRTIHGAPANTSKSNRDAPFRCGCLGMIRILCGVKVL